MGRYISQTDIENVYGQTNVAIWSNLDGSSTSADATRIAAAIAYAEDHVDDRFRQSIYAVPIAGSSGSVPTKVKDWCAKLAGEWLYRGRPSSADGDGDSWSARLAKTIADVDVEISFYLASSRKLDAVTRANVYTAPRVVT